MFLIEPTDRMPADRSSRPQYSSYFFIIVFLTSLENMEIRNRRAITKSVISFTPYGGRIKKRRNNNNNNNTIIVLFYHRRRGYNIIIIVVRLTRRV